MSKYKLLKKAEFNPKLKTYHYILGTFSLFFAFLTIPLIPLWLIFGPIMINKYFKRLECDLTTRSLRFKKGFLIEVEKTIPLDKIQDVTFKEGPFLRFFGLSILKIETAGNSGTTAADLNLIGIIDAYDFRKMIFDQRDNVTSNTSNSLLNSDSVIDILNEIRTSIKNIEQKILKE